MSVLTEVEIARLANAYDELVAEASEAERPWWSLAKAIVLTALGTAMRRGELVGLRWRAVNLLEAKIEVREAFVRGRFTTPKSRASRRVVELGPRTLAVLEEQWRSTSYRGDDDLVFGHPTKGTPLDTSRLAKRYLKPALARAGIEKPFRPFHDLRHTSLTHAAAAGNPQIYVQARAGHSHGSITERYMHAAQVLFPGAAAKSEERMFGSRRQRRCTPAVRPHGELEALTKWERKARLESLQGFLGCGARRRDGGVRSCGVASRSAEPLYVRAWVCCLVAGLGGAAVAAGCGCLSGGGEASRPATAIATLGERAQASDQVASA